VITVVELKLRRSVARLFALPPPMKSRFGSLGETQRQSRSRKSIFCKVATWTQLGNERKDPTVDVLMVTTMESPSSWRMETMCSSLHWTVTSARSSGPKPPEIETGGPLGHIGGVSVSHYCVEVWSGQGTKIETIDYTDQHAQSPCCMYVRSTE
jgi:hypothetical protein